MSFNLDKNVWKMIDFKNIGTYSVCARIGFEIGIITKKCYRTKKKIFFMNVTASPKSKIY